MPERPPYAPSSVCSDTGRWADAVDESLFSESDDGGTDGGDALQSFASRGDAANAAGGGAGSVSPAPATLSVGSRLHDAGRCKPCAFFHTKGCNSGEECLFCHLCPAHEKQRRKRLRRIMCPSILPYDHVRERNHKGELRMNNPRKVGHSRVSSNASATTATSTWAGSSEGRRQHQRQWSGSTQESSSEAPAANPGDEACVAAAVAACVDLPCGAAGSDAADGAGGSVGGTPHAADGDAVAVATAAACGGCGGYGAMCPGMAGHPSLCAPTGYVTCGGVQYAAVPVPAHQYAQMEAYQTMYYYGQGSEQMLAHEKQPWPDMSQMMQPPMGPAFGWW